MSLAAWASRRLVVIDARLTPSAAARSEPDCPAGSQIISQASRRAVTGARPNVATK
jgi:hypothetical protein